MRRVRLETDVVVERIRSRVAELVDGWTTVETQWVKSVDGLRLEPVQHAAEHEPLLVQLETLEGMSGGRSAPVQESRPPISVPVVDTLALIRTDVRRWVRVGLRHRPSSTASDLRRLAAEAWQLAGRNADDAGEADDLHLLDHDVLRWWGRARLVTRWDTAPLRPHVPCMSCGRVGAIQVRFAPTAAVCFECGATWDQATIGILGSHIQLAMELAERPAAVAADAAWWSRLSWMTIEPTMTSGGRP